MSEEAEEDGIFEEGAKSGWIVEAAVEEERSQKELDLRLSWNVVEADEEGLMDLIIKDMILV